jgi:hypothetical protein
MGHLTRLMAYARRVEPYLVPHFLSLSQAVGVVAQYGYSFEYVPSAGVTGLSSKRWHDLFAERLSDVVARLRPTVVVFDGTWPYDGIQRVRDAYPEVRWVWSRRGMWRRGMNAEQLAKAAWFDDVLAPGELAEAYDMGVTSAAGGIRLGPVTLLDADELNDRDAARRALGLPPDRRLALVTLGAGNINDTGEQTGAVVAASPGCRDLCNACRDRSVRPGTGRRTRRPRIPALPPVSRVRLGGQCLWLQLIP